MQFGPKPLFENISVKFGHGNRYGLIGANGCGKSTFMKILDGSLSPTSGNISITPNERIGVLNQDQFSFEQYSAIDTVIMGHTELWAVKQERERIYGLSEMSDADGMKVADLEIRFSELDGYSAESRAGDFLLGAGIEKELHFGPRLTKWKSFFQLSQGGHTAHATGTKYPRQNRRGYNHMASSSARAYLCLGYNK